MNPFFQKNGRGLCLSCLFCVLSFGQFLTPLAGQQLPFSTSFLNGTAFQNPASVGLGVGKNAGIYSYRQWLASRFGAPQTNVAWFQMKHPRQKMGFGGWLLHEEIGPLRQTGLGGSYAYQLSFSGDDAFSMGVSVIGSFAGFSNDFNVKDAADSRIPHDADRRAAQLNADVGIQYRSRADGEKSHFFGGLAARQLVSEQFGAEGQQPGFRRVLHARVQAGYRRMHDFFEWEMRLDADWAWQNRRRGQLSFRAELPEKCWAEAGLVSDFSFGLSAGIFLPTANENRVLFGMEMGFPGKLIPGRLGPSIGGIVGYRWGG